eukprot:TRINITY_DN3952_c0_g1_i1.p1 TRINITY_DN3952_c0_g1~~TRINITY_DN3952_c0_g1_i1.p1  ORF type:complete len:585 (+),score=124.35 TRINITY_DN3952_c0_g1_i1:71-1825(+)
MATLSSPLAVSQANLNVGRGKSGVAWSDNGLEKFGLINLGHQHWNLPTADLVEKALRSNEGSLAHNGPLIVRTGTHTGRAARDKYIVKEETTENTIDWGDVNRPMTEKAWLGLNKKSNSYMQNRDVYVMDVYAGADPAHRMAVRVVTETAWHALFVRNMFLRPPNADFKDFNPDLLIVHTPGLAANPEFDQVRSNTFIAMNFVKRRVLIGGTYYAGEIKKSAFTAMNYYLPAKGILSMHASANVSWGSKQTPSEVEKSLESDECSGTEAVKGGTKTEEILGRTAVFFGLSGTGKTTLSADPSRMLVGDDEHGWSDNGVFNIEGGCYAKVIALDRDAEPEIWNTTRRFGTVLENVGIDMVTRRLDLSDNSLTENTRAAYPIHFIPNARLDGRGGIPTDVVMLTADAFGVLPPIAKLTRDQAMYWFLLGYTSKMAGTEIGVLEPSATFSSCFGLPFMPRPPTVYAKLLGEKIDKHKVRVWLINTGWTGGVYGVGTRMKIKHTRAMLHAALDDKLDDVKTITDPVFGLHVPERVPDVPTSILDPRSTWKDPSAYDTQAAEIVKGFRVQMKKYVGKASEDVLNAGPLI